VWGDADEIIPVECGREYAETISGAQLRIIPECGHFVHLDQPERLAHLLTEFFSS
jgi:4,5:9,10-diseco-3-hydroxy-5,9,17-trioxoandrosta-1(10),2-diene-4-oate hydrolase